MKYKNVFCKTLTCSRFQVFHHWRWSLALWSTPWVHCRVPNLALISEAVGTSAPNMSSGTLNPTIPYHTSAPLVSKLVKFAFLVVLQLSEATDHAEIGRRRAHPRFTLTCQMWPWWPKGGRCVKKPQKLRLGQNLCFWQLIALQDDVARKSAAQMQFCMKSHPWLVMGFKKAPEFKIWGVWLAIPPVLLWLKRCLWFLVVFESGCH